jgi:hypothetical protein
VWTLARIAGLSNIKQSSRYVHPSDDAVLGAMEKLGGHKIGHREVRCTPPVRQRCASNQFDAGPGELILPIDLLDWRDLPGMTLEWRHK